MDEGIGDDVAACIRCPETKRVAISRQYIGYKGMDAVGAAIAESTSLRQFDINRLLLIVSQ